MALSPDAREFSVKIRLFRRLVALSALVHLVKAAGCVSCSASSAGAWLGRTRFCVTTIGCGMVIREDGNHSCNLPELLLCNQTRLELAKE